MAEATTRAGQDAARLLVGIRALVRRFSLSERADVECCGMTVAQAATLETLADGPMRLGDLGRRLGIQPSTLTRNLARLEDRGLVAREQDPADARATRAVLTAAGRKAAGAVARRTEAFAEQVLERIDPARRHELVEGFEEMLLAVREATEQCCPGAFEHLLQEFPERSNCK
jgi:DNA-binding MarR family transcriptional regulator